MIQDLSGSCCIKGTDESTLVTDSLVPLMHHGTDRFWITDPDPDHPKRMHPLISATETIVLKIATSRDLIDLMSLGSTFECPWKAT